MARKTQAERDLFQVETRASFLGERYAKDLVSNTTVRNEMLSYRYSGEDRWIENFGGFVATAFMVGFYAGYAGSDAMKRRIDKDAANRRRRAKRRAIQRIKKK